MRLYILKSNIIREARLSCSSKVKHNECSLSCLLATWMASLAVLKSYCLNRYGKDGRGGRREGGKECCCHCCCCVVLLNELDMKHNM